MNTTPNLQALIELLPCPFCGGKAHLERQGHVACMTPGCRGFGAFDNSGTPSEQNGSAAVRWNTRQAAPTLPGAGGGDAELRAIAQEMRDRKVGHAKRRSPTLCKWADRIDAALPPQQGG